MRLRKFKFKKGYLLVQTEEVFVVWRVIPGVIPLTRLRNFMEPRKIYKKSPYLRTIYFVCKNC